MIEATEASAWSYVTLGYDNVPVHCGRQALDLDLGEWECGHCDSVIHVRNIPNWPTRRPDSGVVA
jgi:hypothetical protein